MDSVVVTGWTGFSVFKILNVVSCVTGMHVLGEQKICIT